MSPGHSNKRVSTKARRPGGIRGLGSMECTNKEAKVHSSFRVRDLESIMLFFPTLFF